MFVRLAASSRPRLSLVSSARSARVGKYRRARRWTGRHYASHCLRCTSLFTRSGATRSDCRFLFSKDVIGWRNDSRKLIVFSTDAGFHYAGDGRVRNRCTLKMNTISNFPRAINYRSLLSERRLISEGQVCSHMMTIGLSPLVTCRLPHCSSLPFSRLQLAGIIEPNDGECHMRNNEYTHSDKQVGDRVVGCMQWREAIGIVAGLSIDWSDQCETKREKREHHLCRHAIAIGALSDAHRTNRRCCRRRIEARLEQYRQLD